MISKLRITFFFLCALLPVHSYAECENDLSSALGTIEDVQTEIQNPYRSDEFFQQVVNLTTDGYFERGLFVDTDSLKLKYLLNTPQESDSQNIQKFIDKHRGSDSIESETLTPIIMATAKCLDIDPNVYTALIKKESTFRSAARSETGAAGLTQMTRAGIEEVHDQLGKRGTRFARAGNVKYFKSDVLDSCLRGQLPSAENFKPLWERVPNNLTDYKMELKNDATTAVIYGGILLKTLLARCNDMGVKPAKNTYKCALMAYNGDPSHMQTYSEIILRDTDRLLAEKPK